MLYRAVVRCRLDHGSIVYSTAVKTNLQQRDTMHITGLSPVPTQSPVCTRGQRIITEGMSVKVVHALLFENSCQQQQSWTLYPAWISSIHGSFMSQAKWKRRYDTALTCPIALNTEAAPHPAFRPEHMDTIQTDTTSLKEWANKLPPDKKPMPNSMSITISRGH